MDAARTVSWTKGGRGTIGRANLDGSGVNGNFIRAPVAVDRAHVYEGIGADGEREAGGAFIVPA
jgi:hypothetical protein